MTKQEYEKLEKVMEEGIKKVEASMTNFKAYEGFIKKDDKVGAEIAQRKGDQNLGYAQGIYQTLVSVSFKHEKMTEFTKLIS